MRLLHTSDWHLGHTLGEHRRNDEFEAFLQWLSDILNREQFDALLIAGDVFDTGAPNNKARELYYQFLGRAAKSKCRNVIIVGGNHDSPSFLNAPKAVLEALNIKIIGAIGENVADEVIPIFDDSGALCGIVCAVPYLRDRDIRTVEDGESGEDKSAKQREAIKRHYSEVCKSAADFIESCAGADAEKIPVIASGHLFAAGVKRQSENGDELIVGALSKIDADVFDTRFDYIALGHIHSAQKVGTSGKAMYCGSPLPLSFDGAKKRVVLDISFDEFRKPVISEIEVPQTRELKKIFGTDETALEEIKKLREKNSCALLEIDYEGDNPSRFRREVENEIKDTELAVCKIVNKKIYNSILKRSQECESLQTLSPIDVFNRLLDAENVPEDERAELRSMYRQTLQKIFEDGDAK